MQEFDKVSNNKLFLHLTHVALESGDWQSKHFGSLHLQESSMTNSVEFVADWCIQRSSIHVPKYFTLPSSHSQEFSTKFRGSNDFILQLLHPTGHLIHFLLWAISCLFLFFFF